MTYLLFKRGGIHKTRGNWKVVEEGGAGRGLAIWLFYNRREATLHEEERGQNCRKSVKVDFAWPLIEVNDVKYGCLMSNPYCPQVYKLIFVKAHILISVNAELNTCAWNKKLAFLNFGARLMASKFLIDI